MLSLKSSPRPAVVPLQNRPARGTTWQAVQSEILSRIRSRHYLPGALIPTERELAAELGCARATVNRALTELASRGVVTRRRKVGTRVTEAMSEAAAVNFPTLSQEIRDSGGCFSHRLLDLQERIPPADVRGELSLDREEPALLSLDLLLSNGEPCCFERRWSRLEIGPSITLAHLDEKQSVSEWMMRNVRYQRVEMWLTARSAGTLGCAEPLGVAADTALIVRHFCGWWEGKPVTVAEQAYPPEHRVMLAI